jgi:hypothetical protein
MFVGQVFAQEVTLDFTLETSEGSKESVWGFPASSKNKTVEEQSFTYGGYTVKVAGSEGEGYYWNDKDHYLLFGKQGAYLVLPAFDFDVERIDIEGNGSASANIKQNIYVGDEAVSDETTGAQETNYFTIAEGKQAAGTIYVIRVNSKHNNQIKTIKVWKKGSGTKQAAEITWSSTSATVTIGADDNVFPILNNPNGLPVSYSSSKEDVATVDANGYVSLVAAGSVKISAIFEGNENYEASTVSYTLTVKAAEGGGGDAQEITVASALEIINALDNGATTSEVYKVKGFVVGDPDFQRKADQTLYGNVNFEMADEKNGTTTLTVFRCKDLENVSFTEETINRIKNGDEVVVQGKLQKYVKNDVVTPEITSCYLVSVGGSTGINAVKADNQNGAVYNVAGQMVNPSYKGLVIKNGKKMIQK